MEGNLFYDLYHDKVFELLCWESKLKEKNGNNREFYSDSGAMLRKYVFSCYIRKRNIKIDNAFVVFEICFYIKNLIFKKDISDFNFEFPKEIQKDYMSFSKFIGRV